MLQSTVFTNSHDSQHRELSYSTIKSIPLKNNHSKIFLGTCQNILLKFMVQFSCLVSLRILPPWYNVSTTHLAFIPNQCPRANLCTPLIIACSLSWQLRDLHAKRTNLISYQKETHHLREYHYLLYWFWNNLPSQLHLLDNFLEVPKIVHTFKSLCIPDWIHLWLEFSTSQ